MRNIGQERIGQIAVPLPPQQERQRISLKMDELFVELETGISEAYADASRTMACNMMDESALEGVQAFIEKRPAAWAVKS